VTNFSGFILMGGKGGDYVNEKLEEFRSVRNLSNWMAWLTLFVESRYFLYFSNSITFI
jgi:hypothetical protein